MMDFTVEYLPTRYASPKPCAPDDVAYVRLAEVDALLGEIIKMVKEINAKSVIPCSIAPELSTTACFDINRLTQACLANLAAWRKGQEDKK